MSIIHVAGNGRTFAFDVYDPRYTTWNHVPGVYGFGIQGGLLGLHHLYFGECESFATRFSNHERWNDALQSGMNVVIAMRTPPHLRFAIEQELIATYNPILNKKHRTSLGPTPLGLGAFGLGRR